MGASERARTAYRDCRTDRHPPPRPVVAPLHPGSFALQLQRLHRRKAVPRTLPPFARSLKLWAPLAYSVSERGVLARRRKSPPLHHACSNAFLVNRMKRDGITGTGKPGGMARVLPYPAALLLGARE